MFKKYWLFNNVQVYIFSNIFHMYRQSLGKGVGSIPAVCRKLEIAVTRNIIRKIYKNEKERERDLSNPGEKNRFLNWFSPLLIGGTSLWEGPPYSESSLWLQLPKLVFSPCYSAGESAP